MWVLGLVVVLWGLWVGVVLCLLFCLLVFGVVGLCDYCLLFVLVFVLLGWVVWWWVCLSGFDGVVNWRLTLPVVNITG